MNVLLYGATGMVGQGVARECERDSGIERIVTVGRRATGRAPAKTREVVQTDLTDAPGDRLRAPDDWRVRFFALGVSSRGMSEEGTIRKITLRPDACHCWSSSGRANPSMMFILRMISMAASAGHLAAATRRSNKWRGWQAGSAALWLRLSWLLFGASW
jgi:hypothetical protein